MTTRHDDPPAWLHKIGVMVRRHPVLAAFTVLVLVVAVPFGNLVVQQAQIRAQNHRIAKQNVAIAGQNSEIQQSRISVTGAVCRALNDQALSLNGQNLYLQSILLGGAKQSRPFEPVYRRLGLPPYKARLEQAKRAASGLGELAVRHIKCDRLDTLVRGNKRVGIPYEAPRFPDVPGFPTLRDR